MNLHEYQGKQLFREWTARPTGYACDTVEVLEAAKKIGGDMFVKAQVHAGGRGKAGGVKLVKSEAEIREFCDAMIGTNGDLPD